MKLALAAFTDAVRLHLSHSVATAVVLATNAAPGKTPETISDEDAGRLILTALAGTVDADSELSAAYIKLPDEMIALEPADAVVHPLLAPWLPQTLADAFGGPVVAGARAVQLKIGAPAFGHVMHFRAGDACGGSALLEFTNASVSLVFGNVDPASPLIVSQTVVGNALFKVGQDARRASVAGGPGAPPNSGGGGEPLVLAGTGSLH